MFSRIICRNTNIPTQNPVEPQVQRSEITDPSENQSSGGQREDHVITLLIFTRVVIKGNSRISQRMTLHLNIADLN